MKRLDRTEIVFKILSYVILTIFALACLYPFIYILANSISSKDATLTGKITIIPDAFNVSAYAYAFTDKTFWISYCNSFFVTMYGTLVSMIVGICGAYALSKKRLLFGRGFNFMIVLTMWFNAGMIPTLNNFQRFNVNNIYMFIIALGFNAFNIILLRNYFSSVSTEIEEAARIDGATEFQILLKVYVPMSKASIVTVAMFYAVARWNGYLWAQMLLTSENYPLTVYIRQTIEEFVRRMEDDPSIASAYDFSQFSVRYAFLVCSIIPIIVIYPKLQKYFAAGVNVGGVKE
jgi:putative aldouronate transport system permease protein